jgi:hypothetical protein
MGLEPLRDTPALKRFDRNASSGKKCMQRITIRDELPTAFDALALMSLTLASPFLDWQRSCRAIAGKRSNFLSLLH